MDDIFMESSNSDQFGYLERDSLRQATRHHMAMSGGGGVVGGGNHSDRSKKLQSENEFLKDRVRSCEKGLGKFYQTLLNSRKLATPSRSSNHRRSASGSYRYDSHSRSPSPESYHLNGGIGMDIMNRISSNPQATISELQSSIEKLISERNSLLSIADDLRQITEAAKRERVLAIDEKDSMLKETHTLRVTVETTQAALSNIEEEREALKEQIQDLRSELITLKRDNDKAKEMRSLALEERSKIVAECSELQRELLTFQSEREELYEETLHLQTQVDDLVRERRKLMQDFEWISKKGSAGYEGMTTAPEAVAVGGGGGGGSSSLSSSRGVKEQSEGLGGKVYDMMEVSLKRTTLSQPWGFTIEGGRGSEFYHQDPSIVVTGVANHTPSVGSLRFGDRILTFGGYDFRNVTRKEAAEMIRSCDLTAITIEIGRASANIKPAPQDIKIPGKKEFGFSYESRLFVTSTEEGTPASNYLQPGDEITQVQGKTAFNMKPSTLKQLLKSCRDGVSLTIQRQAGINITSLASSTVHKSRQTSSSSMTSQMRDSSGGEDARLSLHNGNRYAPPQRTSSATSEFMQSPGTPKSCVSESSAGYYSLTHSMPSEISNSVLPIEPPDSRTGQIGFKDYPDQEQMLTVMEEGRHMTKYVSDSTCGGGGGGILSPDSRQMTKYVSDSACGVLSPDSIGAPRYRMGSATGNSANGLSRSSYRNRPADCFPPRRNTSSGYPPKSGTGFRSPRTSSMSAFRIGTGQSASSAGSRYENILSYKPKVASLTRGVRPIATAAGNNFSKPFSASVDNLDSSITTIVPSTRPTSHPGSHNPSHDPSHDPPNPQKVCGHVASPTDAPSNYPSNHLSVSIGNVQTHV